MRASRPPSVAEPPTGGSNDREDGVDAGRTDPFRETEPGPKPRGRISTDLTFLAADETPISSHGSYDGCGVTARYRNDSTASLPVGMVVLGWTHTRGGESCEGTCLSQWRFC